MKKLHKSTSGMTLIEITVVIALILSLITILLVGFNAYKVGADRAKCILNLSNIQKAVRSYANLNELSAEDPAPGLETEIFGDEQFIPVRPVCPTASYDYDFGPFSALIPPVGEMAAVCTDETYGSTRSDSKAHMPKSTDGW